MKIVLVMITIDRSAVGKTNYFDQTMKQFHKSGLWQSKNPFEFHIYDSGSESHQFMSMWPSKENVWLHSSWFKVPPKVNAGRALLAGSDYDCEWVIFCEDDIQVCRDFLDGAVAFIEKNAGPDYRIITFYTPYREVEQTKAAYWDYPIEKFYGTQCLAMRREDAEACGRYLLTETNYDSNSPSYDLVMKDWHRLAYPNSKFIQATVPSYVQHVGEDSYLLPGRFHTCGSFPGEQWSALS